MISRVARSQVPVLILGETGVGKEMIAREIHNESDRADRPLRSINCAAIPEGLLESTFFGHERGAFTGANQLARGKVEAAQGGTLFLDEIGELPPGLQPKLLRFLENRKFMRVGGTRKIDADVRLMFATLRPLEEEVRAGRFRADLYYRIQGIAVAVPPLRERRADIAPLVNHFVRTFAASHGVAAPRLSRQARAHLLAHDWPGNVRELRNVVETLCLLRGGRTVRAEHLPFSHASRSGAAPASEVAETLEVQLGDTLAKTTARVIEAVLAAERGDKQATAARLGLSVRTLQRYIAAGEIQWTR
jgi:transcriptional regulator with PAS, ATPase and Fis domain